MVLRLQHQSPLLCVPFRCSQCSSAEWNNHKYMSPCISCQCNSDIRWCHIGDILPAEFHLSRKAHKIIKSAPCVVTYPNANYSSTTERIDVFLHKAQPFPIEQVLLPVQAIQHVMSWHSPGVPRRDVPYLNADSMPAPLSHLQLFMKIGHKKNSAQPSVRGSRSASPGFDDLVEQLTNRGAGQIWRYQHLI